MRARWLRVLLLAAAAGCASPARWQPMPYFDAVGHYHAPGYAAVLAVAEVLESRGMPFVRTEQGCFQTEWISAEPDRRLRYLISTKKIGKTVRVIVSTIQQTRGNGGWHRTGTTGEREQELLECITDEVVNLLLKPRGGVRRVS